MSLQPFKTRPPTLTLLALAGLSSMGVSRVAAAEETSKLPPIDFSAYWRMGYQTDINPLQRNNSGQGVNIPTSRHTRNPSYFDLQLGKSFENGMRAQFTVDNEGVTPHQDSRYWGPGDNSDATFLSQRDLRVRELYLELPVGESKIWAGARRFEFEDVRIFDFLNPFNVNGYGVGFIGHGANLSLTTEDGIRDFTPPNPPADTKRDTVSVKDVSVAGRYDISLSDTSALRPMATFKQFGEEAKPDNRRVKGASAFKVGGIYSAWGDSHWTNLGLWFESNPVDPAGQETGTDTAIGLMASTSYEFGRYGLLTGLWLRYDSFKNEKQELKIDENSEGLVNDGDKTTNNNIGASVGLQPVFYATDNVHLALDLNYAYEAKKLNGNSANALFVTPIVRYSLAKNTIGNPQIYTSLTYGSYDWKAKQDAKGKATDSLVTTQTGFEVWF